MNHNILIADSGSTKTDWAAIKSDGTTVANVRTEGLNPFFVDTGQIVEILNRELIPNIPTIEYASVHFYGAGCTPEKSPVVGDALNKLLVAQSVAIHSDMLGAARALCGHQAGIACILGTGANSCSYNGKDIDMNISPLGYILGDEGSGAVLGKQFLGAVLKNQMPKGLKEKFLEQYNTSTADILDRVYKKPNPNRYLASFAPFMANHLHIDEVYRLVEEAFSLFLIRNVKQYPNWSLHQVHFVGSVAHYFQQPLESACEKEHVTLGRILQEPMQGLIEYHSCR